MKVLLLYCKAQHYSHCSIVSIMSNCTLRCCCCCCGHCSLFFVVVWSENHAYSVLMSMNWNCTRTRIISESERTTSSTHSICTRSQVVNATMEIRFLFFPRCKWLKFSTVLADHVVDGCASVCLWFVSFFVPSFVLQWKVRIQHDWQKKFNIQKEMWCGFLSCRCSLACWLARSIDR